MRITPFFESKNAYELKRRIKSESQQVVRIENEEHTLIEQVVGGQLELVIIHPKSFVK